MEKWVDIIIGLLIGLAIGAMIMTIVNWNIEKTRILVVTHECLECCDTKPIITFAK